MNPVALIVHGGAGAMRPETASERRTGVLRALERGWAILDSGGAALDACEEAIVELENDPMFNAGVGSHLNREGRAQLDAILMDGAALNAGAVAAVERVRNPIRLARRIMEHSEHVLLVGAGAEQFASEHHVPLCDPAELATPVEQQRWSARCGAAVHLGTVGAAALDRFGSLAAGTSTGGTFLKHPGRVGDSPMIGCGCYADNWSGAVSCTGHGESIMKVVMAKAAADFIAAGHSAETAAEMAIQILSRRTTGTGGLIIVDREGRVGAAHSTAHMTWAARTSDGIERVNA